MSVEPDSSLFISCYYFLFAKKSSFQFTINGALEVTKIEPIQDMQFKDTHPS